MANKKDLNFETKVIHAGQKSDPTTGAVMTPIVLASTFEQSSPGIHKGYDYSRSINPTGITPEKPTNYCLTAMTFPTVNCVNCSYKIT